MPKSPALSPVAAAIVLALLALAPSAARAETIDTDVLTAGTQPVPVDGGNVLRFSVALRIKPAYHIMANPPSEEFYIPTTLTLAAAAEGLKLDVTYPPGRDYALGDLPGPPLKVYAGDVRLDCVLRSTSGALNAPMTVPLVLRYQACSDKACLAPADVELKLDLIAAQPGPATAESSRSSEPAVEETPQSEIPATTAVAATEEGGDELERLEGALERGLVWLLVVVFGWGLALNATPCVYPMVPIVMGFFASQGERRVARTFPLAAAYALGMSLAFTGLGMLASFGGRQLGIVLQSPAAVVALSIIMALLAASLFGAFEIRVPTRLLAGLQGLRGPVGALLMGGALGLVAAPCVGPTVLALVVFVARRGSVPLGGLLFFVLALGLALPYLVLGTFTGLINRVPRGGGWLVWVKRVLAFPVLAMILYFAQPYLPEWLLWTLAAALAAAAAIYLGIFEGWSRRPWGRGMIVARIVVALAFAAGSVTLFTREAMPALGWGDARQEIAWQPFAAKALADAREADRPVVLYFTASWCSLCHDMARGVFRDDDVHRAVDGVTLLKIDVTSGHAADPAAEALRQRYASAGPPVLVFFDGANREIAVRTGLVAEADLLALLRAAREFRPTGP